MAIQLSNLIFLGTLGFTLAAPLGPVNMEMIKRGVTNSKGYLLSLVTGFGAMTGDFVVAMSVLLVGSEFFEDLLDNKLILFTLFLANTAILTKIGLGAIKMEVTTEFLQESEESIQLLTPMRVGKQYGIGFIIVTTSPWSYLWWASFGPIVFSLDLPLESFGDKLIVTLMFLSGILVWVLSIGISLKISQNIASEKTLTYITRGSAALILVFAVSVGIDAIWILIYDEPLLLINRFFELFT